MNIVQAENLTHSYGNKEVLKDINFTVEQGKIFGLLGKNGTGKTTTINILMGFLQPSGGRCTVFGEPSHSISPETRAKIGLLHEGHVQYEFMSIVQIERFYSRFYPTWKRDLYYELIDRMQVSHDHRISKLSCGQRSQVALGLLFAQNPELLILDDYSMGLDAGYRRLFLDYLTEFIKDNHKTVFITSHIIQDMEQLIDDTIILGYDRVLLQSSLQDFLANFHKYELKPMPDSELHPDPAIIQNIEIFKHKIILYSFQPITMIDKFLKRQKYAYSDLKEVSMTLEDAFIGLTGKY